MIEIALIRHGKTDGNIKMKYIGVTDENLSDIGKNELLSNSTSGIYKDIDYVYLSPMKRCIESSNIIFPNANKTIIEDFREMNFGIFENKTHDELKHMEDYILWHKSEWAHHIPQGENIIDFKNRCANAFTGLFLNNVSDRKFAIVAHGGVIMAIMERFLENATGYYDYFVKNGEGYYCSVKMDGQVPVLNIINKIASK